MNPDPTAADPLPHARSLAVLGSVFVLALSGLCWGHRGFVSASAGSLLSFVNVWAIEGFARRAVERATMGDVSVAGQLTAALSAKMVVLLTASWVLIRVGRLLPLPFGLGYLVSVFSLLGAGLFTARREA